MATAKSTKKSGNVIAQFILVGTILVGVVVLLTYLGVFKVKPKGLHEITYRVDGGASTALVTYSLEDGSRSPKLDVTLPWNTSIYIGGNTTVVLTAGNTSQVGSIRCAILLDGKEWKKETNVNPGDKVSCAGIVPP